MVECICLVRHRSQLLETCHRIPWTSSQWGDFLRDNKLTYMAGESETRVYDVYGDTFA
jgi:hypothetical protein